MRISKHVHERRVTMSQAKLDVLRILDEHGLSAWETVTVLNELIAQQAERRANAEWEAEEASWHGGTGDTPVNPG